ncbi:hypothetical protein SDC9_52061 [bioreactor metagenome]|uniref:DUF192 domain-containing protein n=1 Tax=bioreactor metagenome TaxID=1076179 RepID=A0A644WPE2_9ZZZZ
MVVSCNQRIVADKVNIAHSFFTRFIGLMGKKKLGAGEGLLLMNCSAIHCFFMKMTIDAVYLSNDMTVLDIETLTPWSIGRHVKHTAHVLELSPNTAQFSAGDVLQLFENKR